MIRSGCCWFAGNGRVFYFQPGHETYPVYFQREVKRIVANACRWAAGRTNSPGGVGGSWWKLDPPAARTGGASTGRLGEHVPELTAEEVRMLVAHLRWSGRPLRGNMDAYRAVRFAALNEACARVATEVERASREGNQGLLALAARLRERCLNGDTPDDLPLPQWREDRPTPELDAERVRREQQIGFGLGLAHCAARVHIAAGGRL